MKIGALLGKRYLVNKRIQSKNKFANNYCIRIEENYQKYDKDTIIKNTPITITVDGVVIVATTAVILLALSAGGIPIGGSEKHTDLSSINKKINCNKEDNISPTFFLLF